jgi:hypothetical protein
LTSTAANAMAAYIMATMAKIFFNMVRFLGWLGTGQTKTLLRIERVSGD